MRVAPAAAAAAVVSAQVITSAEFHPKHCNIFAYSSSKGCIRLADMRNSALCDRHAKAYEEVDTKVSSSSTSSACWGLGLEAVTALPGTWECTRMLQQQGVCLLSALL